MNIMVAGAGILGRELITLLLKKGYNVTGLALSVKEFEGLEHSSLRTIAADVTKQDTLSGVCQGVDIVISCIGITRLKGKLTHMDVDCHGNLNLLKEAEDSGVDKFGIVSPEGVDEGGHIVPLLEARKCFEELLRGSSVQWVVFHSGGFFSDLAQMAVMAKKSPLFVIGTGQNRFTPIAVHDLAHIVIEDMLTRANEVIHVGGPEDLSWTEICKTCFEQWGLKPRIWSVPIWLSKVTLWLIKPFSKRNDAMGRLILFMSTTDLPTPQRGRTRFADFLVETARLNPTFGETETP